MYGFFRYIFVLFYFILIFAAFLQTAEWECERNGKTHEKRKIRVGFCYGCCHGTGRHRLRQFWQQFQHIRCYG